MKLLAGFLVLFFSVNIFADGNPIEVKFSNGARLELKIESGVAREILYYEPGSIIPELLSIGGDKKIISLVSEKNPTTSPAQILNEKFEGKPTNFWPVVVTEISSIGVKSVRYYISEYGEILTVAYQLIAGRDPQGILEFPNYWELHRLAYGKHNYLVLIEEIGGEPKEFHYLKLGDGQMATYIDASNRKGYFDSTTGLVVAKKDDGSLATYPPTELVFKERTVGSSEVIWFPNLNEAERLILDSVGPFEDTSSTVGDPKESEEKKPDEKKKGAEVARSERVSAAMKIERANFKTAAAKFAQDLGSKSNLKPVAELYGNRFVLLATKAKRMGSPETDSLAVVDSWTGRTIDEIILEDEKYSVFVDARNTNTMTIAYPSRHLEVIYSQPTNMNPQIKELFRNKESIGDYCRNMLDREGKIVETAKPAKVSQ